MLNRKTSGMDNVTVKFHIYCGVESMFAVHVLVLVSPVIWFCSGSGETLHCRP